MLKPIRFAGTLLWFALSIACSAGSAYDIELVNGPAGDRLDTNGQATFRMTVSALRDLNSVGVLCLSPTSQWEWTAPPPQIPALTSGQVHGPSDYTIHARTTVPEAGRPITFFAVLGIECPTSAPADGGATTNESDQITQTIKPVAPPPTAANLMVMLIDSVAAGPFSIAVNQPAAGQPVDRPQAGQASTLKFTVRNLATSTISVPWQMTIAGAMIIGAGTVPVPANGAVDVSAPWTPSAGGQVRLAASVDPAATIERDFILRLNNHAVLDVNVSALPPTDPPPATPVPSTDPPTAAPVIVSGSVALSGPFFTFTFSVCNVVPTMYYRVWVNPPVLAQSPIGSPGAGDLPPFAADGTTLTPPCPTNSTRPGGYTDGVRGLRPLFGTTAHTLLVTAGGSGPFPPPGWSYPAGYFDSAPVTFVVR